MIKNIFAKAVITVLCLCILLLPSISNASTQDTLQNTAIPDAQSASVSNTQAANSASELHAFYPSNAVYSEQMQKYIDSADSLSFAWSRFDAADPGNLNITKGQNDNDSFYYPDDFIKPVQYAKSQGKSIQLSIFMNGSDSTQLLPFADKRASMEQAVTDFIKKDITQGEGLYYDGVVIDFEGLRDTDGSGQRLLYDGKPISTYFSQFLGELKSELEPLGKKLYVAVNPLLYYDGYDYKSILETADRVILMAHDYSPAGKLAKSDVMQYTAYDPKIYSLAPVEQVRRALSDMKTAAAGTPNLSKVLLQISFDSAQWWYEVSGPDGWDSLDPSVLSVENRNRPLYANIKARIDNLDGTAKLSYGYNNELQCPYIQFYNIQDKTWNIVVYEDSTSIAAKVELAKAYGIGGISVWSLKNIPDYNDASGKRYRLDGWSTLLTEVKAAYSPTAADKAVVKFTDKTVEKAVRAQLYQQTGSITAGDLKKIYRLTLPAGVKSLKDLKGMVNLEYLDARGLGIKDITTLAYLTNLHVLYLPQNQISDVSSLKKLTKLQILSLNGNPVKTVTALSALINLQELYLEGDKLTSVKALSSLKKLAVLNLGANSIKDISSLAVLKNLSTLYLDGNGITNISALSGMTGLVSLDLSNNKIADVKALKNLVKLEKLYLQRNLIKDARPLSGLKKLRELSLNGNRLTDVSALAGNTSLEKLYLKDNKIVKVDPLKGLINLKELYLKGNPVKDYSPLKTIGGKPGFLCDFKV